MKTTFIVVVAVLLLITYAKAEGFKTDDKESLKAEESKIEPVESKEAKDELLNSEETKAQAVLAEPKKDELAVGESKEKELKAQSNEKDALEGQETRRIDPPHPAPEPYQFSFETKDPKAGEQFRQEDGNKDGVVRGSYGFRTPEGVFRVVDYIADHDGFRAKIRSNEPGIANQDPTDVIVEKNGGEAIVEGGQKDLPPPPPPPPPSLQIQQQQVIPIDDGKDYRARLPPPPPERLPPPPPPPLAIGAPIEDGKDYGARLPPPPPESLPPPPPPPLAIGAPIDDGKDYGAHLPPPPPESLPPPPPPPLAIGAPLLKDDGPKDVPPLEPVGVNIPPPPPSGIGIIDGNEGKDISGGFDQPPRVTVVHHEESYDKPPRPVLLNGYGKDVVIGAPPYRDAPPEKHIPPPPPPPPPAVRPYDDEVVYVKEPPSDFKQYGQKSIPPPPPPAPPVDYLEEQIKAAPPPPPSQSGHFGGGYSTGAHFDAPPRVTVIHHESAIDKPIPGVDGLSVIDKPVPGVGGFSAIGRPVPGEEALLPPVHGDGKQYDGVIIDKRPPSYEGPGKPIVPSVLVDTYPREEISIKSQQPPPPSYVREKDIDLDVPPRVTVIHHDSSIEGDGYSKPVLGKDIPTVVRGKSWVPLRGSYEQAVVKNIPPPPPPPPPPSGSLEKPPLPQYDYDEGVIAPKLPPPIYGKDITDAKILGPGLGKDQDQKALLDGLDIPPRVTVIHHDLRYNKFGGPRPDFDVAKGGDIVNDKEVPGKGYGGDIVAAEGPLPPPLEQGVENIPEKPLPPLPVGRGYGGELDIAGKSLPPLPVGKEYDGRLDIPPRVSVVHHIAGGFPGAFKDGLPPPKDEGAIFIKKLPEQSVVEYESGKKFHLPYTHYGGQFRSVPCPPYLHTHYPPNGYYIRDYRGKSDAKPLPPLPVGNEYGGGGLPILDKDVRGEHDLPPLDKGFGGDRDLPPRVSVIHHKEGYNKLISPGSYGGRPFPFEEKDKALLTGPVDDDVGGGIVDKDIPQRGYHGHAKPLPPLIPRPPQDERYADVKVPPPSDYAIPLPPGGYSDGEIPGKRVPPGYDIPDKEAPLPPPPKYGFGDSFVKDTDLPPRVTVIHHDAGYNGPSKSITTLRYSRYNDRGLLHPELNYGGFRGNFYLAEERPRFIGPPGDKHLYPVDRPHGDKHLYPVDRPHGDKHLYPVDRPHGDRHLYPINFGGPRVIGIDPYGKDYGSGPVDKYYSRVPFLPRPRPIGVKSVHQYIPREPPRIIKVLRPFRTVYDPNGPPVVKPKAVKIVAIKGDDAIKQNPKVVNVVSLLVALRPQKCPSVCG